MKSSLDRRRFLATTAAVGMGTLVGGRLRAETPATASSSTEDSAEEFQPLPKALIGPPTEKVLRQFKAAGFEGIEAYGKAALTASPVEAAKMHLTAEKLGMRIHSVMFGWTNFNSPDAGQVAREIDDVKTALRAAQGFGADTLLLVPCKVEDKKIPMPQPWEFDIRFDEKTGHLRQVVAGDNSKYEKYIEAHNASTDASKKAVAKLLPVAERTGVVIALENVWNNLWVTPEPFAHFVGSFNSHWVQAYLDLANGVKYALTEDWIQALGKLIVKCHVKGFRLNPDGHGGQFVNIRDGSINWPLARHELAKVGYEGWMTIEGSGRLPLDERNKRLDLILAGK
ncbi:MAG: TIM barrel protein [Pirellulales bacterium]|nr:TIM barrel protein [Pirellulales bacterium]